VALALPVTSNGFQQRLESNASCSVVSRGWKGNGLGVERRRRGRLASFEQKADTRRACPVSDVARPGAPRSTTMPAGHVFAAVITTALNKRHGAAVANREALPRGRGQNKGAAGGAIIKQVLPRTPGRPD